MPESYTFWDLHVAVQDAMGWLDYHLHVFRFAGAEGTRPIAIGIPDEDDPNDPIIPGWTVGIADLPAGGLRRNSGVSGAAEGAPFRRSMGGVFSLRF